MPRNIVDRVISYFNPRAGADRERYRFLQEILEKRRYEAAGVGARTKGWRTSSTGPNTEVDTGLRRLRDRSRDLVRNNPHASRAVKVISGNTIGTGIIPQPARGGEIHRLWREWGETTQCDAAGLNNFYGLQDLLVQSMVEGGDCLLRRRIRTSDKNLSVPLQIEVLEGDFIDETKNETSTAGGGFIWNGIEFDSRGRRAAYWLYNEHPGDARAFRTSYESVRVPASEIIHLYRQDRIGQVRGVPWGAPCLLKLRDLHEYEDAQLLRQKIAACFAGFIKDSDAAINEPEADPFESQMIKPGTLSVLPPGKDIELSTPPTVGADFEPYMKVSLRSVAAGFGITYEALTSDYSNVNFSSGRMGWLEFNRDIQKYRWLLFIPRVCDPVWDWFVQVASLRGAKPTEADARPKWTAPKREMIDPIKETQGAIRAIRAGITTLSETIREQGYDPDDHFEEMQKDNQRIDTLHLILDSDARTTNLSGALQLSNDKNEIKDPDLDADGKED